MGNKEGPWTGKLLGGRYRLGNLLGEGGVGGVYEGVQEGLKRPVAVKVLLEGPNQEEQAMARLEREAMVIASLEHPNIVQVIDFQKSDDGPAFMVMDLLRGRSLNEVINDEGPMSAQRISFIVDQVLAALNVAHRAGVVHRDLKPHNIFLTSISGVDDVVKLLDFGVAKYIQQSEDKSQDLTKTGLVVGTPAYMAPEHLLGQKVDGRTDLYSLGVVLYRAVAKESPFSGANYNSLIVSIMRHAYPPLIKYRQDLDDGFMAVVERAMAKDADERFASAEQMRQALKPWSSPEPGTGPHRSAENFEDSAASSAPAHLASGPLEASVTGPAQVGQPPAGEARTGPMAGPREVTGAGQAAGNVPRIDLPDPPVVPEVAPEPGNLETTGPVQAGTGTTPAPAGEPAAVAAETVEEPAVPAGGRTEPTAALPQAEAMKLIQPPGPAPRPAVEATAPKGQPTFQHESTAFLSSEELLGVETREVAKDASVAPTPDAPTVLLNRAEDMSQSVSQAKGEDPTGLEQRPTSLSPPHDGMTVTAPTAQVLVPQGTTEKHVEVEQPGPVPAGGKQAGSSSARWIPVITGVIALAAIGGLIFWAVGYKERQPADGKTAGQTRGAPVKAAAGPAKGAATDQTREEPVKAAPKIAPTPDAAAPPDSAVPDHRVTPDSRPPARDRAVVKRRPQPAPRKRGKPGNLRVGLMSGAGRSLWAEVYVDGRRRGGTPTLVRGLSPGRHRVELRRPGKPPLVKTVTIKSGQTKSLLLEVKY